MKTIILAAIAIALVPAAAQAQLLGGGGLGGSIGGALDGTLRGSIPTTIHSTTRTLEGTVTGRGSTRGSQSVDARKGTVHAERSAEGSITGSTASLADLVVPPMAGTAQASGSGSTSGQGNASAQLIGTDAVAGALAPVAAAGKGLAAETAGNVTATAQEMLQNMPMPGMPDVPAASQVGGEGSGSADTQGSATLLRPALAVAGSAAATGQGMASVAPGMPVMMPDGASLGTVREIVANGRGEVEQVIVQQGEVTRALPSGMFTASGGALVAGEAQAERSEPAPAADEAAH